MRRDMKPGDRVAVTLDGVAHEFGPDRVRVSVDDTSTRGGARSRYATLVVQLDDEFPEDLATHIARVREES